MPMKSQKKLDATSSENENKSLRKRAEKQAHQKMQPSATDISGLSPLETERLLQELQVHQIELEMQNEELRRFQSELEESRERYFSLFDLAPVGYLNLNRKGVILEANLTASRLLNVERRALINQLLSGFLLREDQDKYYLFRKKLVETGLAQTCELRLLKNDGTFFWGRLESISAEGSDGVIVDRVAISDITERKKTEDELEQAYAKEQLLSRHLEEEARERIQFIDVLAHELKGPLTPMLASAGLLCELISSGRKPDLLKNIADNFFNGTQILVKRLEELLDVARFARGAVNLNLEPVDIRRFIDQVVSRYAPSITQRHQSIVTDLSRDLPPVTLDQSRVEQVLINLLSNASKYSPEGASILLSAGICQDELLISVKDEGVGISEEEQSHLFKPYQRLGKEQQKVLGLGLGLTVVKNIVEAHGGRVSLTSKPGQGSIFSFTLPISENHDARTAKPEISESK